MTGRNGRARARDQLSKPSFLVRAQSVETEALVVAFRSGRQAGSSKSWTALSWRDELGTTRLSLSAPVLRDNNKPPGVVDSARGRGGETCGEVSAMAPVESLLAVDASESCVMVRWRLGVSGASFMSIVWLLSAASVKGDDKQVHDRC